MSRENYLYVGMYYSGLELRRMDQYEILKRGEFVRYYDINRGYK